LFDEDVDLPNAFSVSSRVFSTAARSVTSTFSAVTAEPISLPISLRSFPRGLVVIPDRDLAPEAAKRSAIARQTPARRR